MSANKVEYCHNIWSFEEDHIIETDGSLIMAIELFNGDLSCLSNQSILNVGQSMSHLLESYDEDTQLIVINHLENKNAYENILFQYSKFDKTKSKLFSKSKVENIRKLNIVKPRTILFIRKQINSPSLNKYFELLKRIKRDVQKSLHFLNNTIFKTKVLQKKDLLKIYYNYLNGSQLISNVDLDQNNLLEKEIEVGRTLIRVGNKLRRTISLYHLPLMTEPGLCMSFCNGSLLNEVIEYQCSVNINIVNQKEKIAKLKTKSLKKTFLAELTARKNHDAEAGIEDIDELLTDIAKNGTKLIEFSMNIHISDENIDRLNEKTDQILNLFSNLEEGSYGIVEEYDQYNLYLSHLPGLTNEKIRNFLLTSKNVSDLLPIYKNWEGTMRPKQILFNKDHGLLPIDPFDDNLQAYNAIIFGSTGSGKSFTANYLLQSFLSQGKNVTIVDIGGSYKKLVDLFNGEYFEINNNISLNPFYDPKDLELEKDIKLGVLSTIIEAMISEENGCDSTEKAIIDKALIKLYKNRKITPILSDFEKTLKSLIKGKDFTHSKVESIIERLQIWTNGRYAKMINQPESIYSDNQVIAFDLKGLDKRLQTVVLNILSGLIWNRITQTQGEKIVLFDEVWSLFKSQSSSLMIEELYRTARKYHAGIYSISQSLEDFTQSSIAPAIMNNSIIRYCLKLKDKPEVIKKYLSLNDHEVQLIQSLKSVKGHFSEMFLCFSDQHCLTKIKPSPLEYWVCTTSKKDLDKESIYKKLHPKLPHLHRLEKIALEYPNGC